jgi:hypothetical protein
MATLVSQALKPQSATLILQHPVVRDTILQEIEDRNELLRLEISFRKNQKPTKKDLLSMLPSDEEKRRMEFVEVPDGEGGVKEVQGKLEIIGQYSDEFVEAAKAMVAKVDNEGIDLTASDMKMFNKVSGIENELLSDIVVGWEDNGYFSTKYSKEECVHLLSLHSNHWIVQQIYSFISKQSNFFKKK